MSRKACRRKVWPLTNTISMAIEGAAITDTARLDKLRMLELSALEAFRTGLATPDDWRVLADMCNVAETLATTGTGPEVLEPCLRAQEALGAVHARFVSCGRMGLAGPELHALRQIYEWHDLQRTSVGRSVYERAIQKTADRIRGAAPDIKVFI